MALPPLPPGLLAPPDPPLPPHKLTVYELDKRLPLQPGINPLQIAVLSLPHQVTVPRREQAAGPLVERHAGRKPIEINHCPGGDLTAIVEKG